MVHFGRRLALGLSSILADSGALFLCPLNEGAGEYAGTMLSAIGLSFVRTLNEGVGSDEGMILSAMALMLGSIS